MIGRLALATLLVSASMLGGCSTQMGEAQLLRPVAGGALSQASLTAAAPAYLMTQHMIAAADGTRLGAVLLRQPGARATVLYFGGNGFTIERVGAYAAKIFAPLGVDLMIADHRGYGTSGGTLTIAALESDGLAIFDYLGKIVDPRMIVVHGQSLGSFTAGHVAANRAAAGVVLESSVTTAEEWIAARTGGAAGAFIRVGLDDALKGRGNLQNVARIEEPLLLLVGSKDAVTPPSLSEALLRASPLPATAKFLTVAGGAGHNDVLVKPETIAAYRAFLTRALPRS